MTDYASYGALAIKFNEDADSDLQQLAVLVASFTVLKDSLEIKFVD